MERNFKESFYLQSLSSHTNLPSMVQFFSISALPPPEGNEYAAASGASTPCTVRTVEPDSPAQEFHCGSSPEDDVLEHFRVAPVVEQGYPVVMFSHLFNESLYQRPRIWRIQPYSAIPFLLQTVVVPVVHYSGGLPQRVFGGARICVERAERVYYLLRSVPLIRGVLRAFKSRVHNLKQS